MSIDPDSSQPKVRFDVRVAVVVVAPRRRGGICRGEVRGVAGVESDEVGIGREPEGTEVALGARDLRPREAQV